MDFFRKSLRPISKIELVSCVNFFAAIIPPD
jgi:hypothetical protein